MKAFLYIMLVLGTLVPLYFFANHFWLNGFSLSAAVGGLFANPIASGFTADVLLSILVFLVWTFYEYRQQKGKWLLLLLASCLVGLSLSLPIYLLYKLHDINAKKA